MAVFKEKLNKANIDEFLKNSALTEVDGKENISNLEDWDVLGKWFCPLKLQGIVNTFPPVWNFNPKSYKFKKKEEDCLYEIYLSGDILEKGKIDYYLGLVKVFPDYKEKLDDSDCITKKLISL